MKLNRYQDHHDREYEGTQLTPENMEEVANHLNLEYVKEYVDKDGGVEEALFRSGDSDPILVGDFVLQRVNSNEQAHAVLAGDFSHFYKEIGIHAFIPQITHSTDMNYPAPCVFCGNERHTVPYHRDAIPGETLKLPNGSTLTIVAAR